MGYEINRFKATVNDCLLCPICRKVLQDPVQLDCVRRSFQEDDGKSDGHHPQENYHTPNGHSSGKKVSHGSTSSSTTASATGSRSRRSHAKSSSSTEGGSSPHNTANSSTSSTSSSIMPANLSQVKKEDREKLHLFCRCCIVDHFAESGVVCPLDDQKLKRNTNRSLITTPPKLILDSLSKLEIECDFFSQCSTRVPLGDLNEHLETCPYKTNPVIRINMGSVYQTDRRVYGNNYTDTGQTSTYGMTPPATAFNHFSSPSPYTHNATAIANSYGQQTSTLIGPTLRGAEEDDLGLSDTSSQNQLDLSSNSTSTSSKKEKKKKKKQLYCRYEDKLHRMDKRYQERLDQTRVHFEVRLQQAALEQMARLDAVYQNSLSTLEHKLHQQVNTIKRGLSSPGGLPSTSPLSKKRRGTEVDPTLIGLPRQTRRSASSTATTTRSDNQEQQQDAHQQPNTSSSPVLSADWKKEVTHLIRTEVKRCTSFPIIPVNDGEDTEIEDETPNTRGKRTSRSSTKSSSSPASSSTVSSLTNQLNRCLQLLHQTQQEVSLLQKKLATYSEKDEPQQQQPQNVATPTGKGKKKVLPDSKGEARAQLFKTSPDTRTTVTQQASEKSLSTLGKEKRLSKREAMKRRVMAMIEARKSRHPTLPSTSSTKKASTAIEAAKKKKIKAEKIVAKAELSKKRATRKTSTEDTSSTPAPVVDVRKKGRPKKGDKESSEKGEEKASSDLHEKKVKKAPTAQNKKVSKSKESPGQSRRSNRISSVSEDQASADQGKKQEKANEKDSDKKGVQRKRKKGEDEEEEPSQQEVAGKGKNKKKKLEAVQSTKEKAEAEKVKQSKVKTKTKGKVPQAESLVKKGTRKLRSLLDKVKAKDVEKGKGKKCKETTESKPTAITAKEAPKEKDKGKLDETVEKEPKSPSSPPPSTSSGITSKPQPHRRAGTQGYLKTDDLKYKRRMARIKKTMLIKEDSASSATKVEGREEKSTENISKPTSTGPKRSLKGKKKRIKGKKDESATKPIVSAIPEDDTTQEVSETGPNVEKVPEKDKELEKKERTEHFQAKSVVDAAVASISQLHKEPHLTLEEVEPQPTTQVVESPATTSQTEQQQSVLRSVEEATDNATTGPETETTTAEMSGATETSAKTSESITTETTNTTDTTNNSSKAADAQSTNDNSSESNSATSSSTQDKDILRAAMDAMDDPFAVGSEDAMSSGFRSGGSGGGTATTVIHPVPLPPVGTIAGKQFFASFPLFSLPVSIPVFGRVPTTATTSLQASSVTQSLTPSSTPSASSAAPAGPKKSSTAPKAPRKTPQPKAPNKKSQESSLPFRKRRTATTVSSTTTSSTTGASSQSTNVAVISSPTSSNAQSETAATESSQSSSDVSIINQILQIEENLKPSSESATTTTTSSLNIPKLIGEDLLPELSAEDSQELKEVQATVQSVLDDLHNKNDTEDEDNGDVEGKEVFTNLLPLPIPDPSEDITPGTDSPLTLPTTPLQPTPVTETTTSSIFNLNSSATTATVDVPTQIVKENENIDKEEEKKSQTDILTSSSSSSHHVFTTSTSSISDKPVDKDTTTQDSKTDDAEEKVSSHPPSSTTNITQNSTVASGGEESSSTETTNTNVDQVDITSSTEPSSLPSLIPSPSSKTPTTWTPNDNNKDDNNDSMTKEPLTSSDPPTLPSFQPLPTHPKSPTSDPSSSSGSGSGPDLPPPISST